MQDTLAILDRPRHIIWNGEFFEIESGSGLGWQKHLPLALNIFLNFDRLHDECRFNVEQAIIDMNELTQMALTTPQQFNPNDQITNFHQQFVSIATNIFPNEISNKNAIPLTEKEFFDGIFQLSSN